MTLRRASAALAGTLLALALVGCSSDESGGSSAPEQESSSAEQESSSPEQTSDADQVSGGGVSFDSPEGWKSVDAADVSDQTEGNAELDKAAEEMGLDPEQLRQTLGNAELLLLDPESAATGYADNINVMVPGGALPPESAIEEQFSSIGATVQEVTTEETDLGEVVSVAYELPLSGTTIHGEALATEVDGDMVTITVSTSDRADTTRLADDVLSSLTAAP